MTGTALLRLEPIHHVDIEPLRQKTRSMLKEAKTWAAVEEVAAALLEKACLTGDEVNRIIGRVVGRGLVPGPMLEIKGGEGE